MFGMHPNAEIGFLTTMCETLFGAILEIQGGASTGGSKKDDGVMTILMDLKGRCPNEFNFFDIQMKIKGDKSPFQVVCL
jgi:dynein heavy chain